MMGVSMSEGFIYILTNRSLKDNIVKIGKTSRSPEERAREISSNTGVATPFEVAFKVEVYDCDMIELLVHQELSKYRVNQDREFFAINFEKARSIISAVVALHLKIKIDEDCKKLNMLAQNITGDDFFNIKKKLIPSDSDSDSIRYNAEKYYSFALRDRDSGDYKSAYNNMKRSADVFLGISQNL